MTRDQAGVPLSQPLGRGTVGQSPFRWDSQRDGGGTADLKALARKVLARDTQRDGDGTVAKKGVPRPSDQWDTSDGHPTAFKSPSENREAQTAGNTPTTSDDASRAPDHSLIGSGAPADSAESAADRFEERAALIEYGAGVPREWAEGFARLDLAAPPAGFDAKRWRTLIDDGGKFLDRWGGEAARLGWSVLDLFGAHPVAPAFRYDAAGLVNLISGGDVVDIRTDRAVIRTPAGNSLTYYLRRDCSDAVALWDLGSVDKSAAHR